ncbi:MAG: hypothetical protein RJB58_2189 [Pseudomonadota bacterium]|jgi:putative acetyltransferase
MEVVPVAAPTQDVRLLVDELNDELSGLYTPQPQREKQFVLETLFQPHIRFFVARQGGQPAGCGGVALFADFAEVKRMYVRSHLRGQGIADALMARLIAEAAQGGLKLLRLETGIYSSAAIAFYRRCGFVGCGAYEPYASMPPHTVATSVFMERHL